MKGSSGAKVLPLSAKKLRGARRKGRVATSREFIGAAGSAAALSVLPWQDALPALLSRVAAVAAGFVLPLLGLIVLCVLAASVVSNGGVAFSVDPLLPKMERINPVAGFKRVASMRNAVNGIKTVLQFIVVGATVSQLRTLGWFGGEHGGSVPRRRAAPRKERRAPSSARSRRSPGVQRPGSGSEQGEDDRSPNGPLSTRAQSLTRGAAARGCVVGGRGSV